MAKKFATNIDLLLNELQNAKIHISAADLSGGVAGQVFYDSTNKVLKFHNGTAWVPLGYLDQMPATAAVSVNNYKITNLATPSNPTDAANKQYVDSLSQGIDAKASVRCATTANITLSATQTIDGVAVVAGDRVLVKNQTTASANGIYIVAASAWVRASDMDEWDEFVGGFCFVEEGTANADTGWLCSVDRGGTLGTTSVTFVQFSAAGQVSASNLGSAGFELFAAKSGNDLQFRQLSIPAGQGAVTLTKNTNDIQINASAKIEALQDLATNGIIVQTGTSTFHARQIIAPAAGITISNGDGLSGNPTLALANDLAGVEGLSTTGLATRTADGTWTTHTLTGSSGITITNGNGVLAAPNISINSTALQQTLGFVKSWSGTFTFVSSGVDIALTHNLGLASGTYNRLHIKVYETASFTEVMVEESGTIANNTNNVAYIKLLGTGLSTTAGYYTALIFA